MSAPAAPVVRPALGGKAVELLSQALLITAVPAALGPADYGTLALMLGIATVASAALALGGPAAVSLLVSAAPADQHLATARTLALRGLAWRELAVVVALAIALAAGAALTSRDTAAGPPRARAAETTVAIPSISARVP